MPKTSSAAVEEVLPREPATPRLRRSWLVCLRLLFLLVSHLFGWLRLSRRDESWKSAEILLLRHQLTVLQRQVPARPKTTWADRALLAALVEVIPRRRRAGLRLMITPETVLRWRRDIVRRRWARKSQHKRPGRPATHHNITALVVRLAREKPGLGLPAHPRRTRRTRHPGGALDSVGDPDQRRDSTSATTDRADMGAVLARPS